MIVPKFLPPFVRICLEDRAEARGDGEEAEEVVPWWGKCRSGLGAGLRFGRYVRSKPLAAPVYSDLGNLQRSSTTEITVGHPKH